MASQIATDTFKKSIKRTLEQTAYSSDISDVSPFFPQHIHIEPTNACNLRCVHCHHHTPQAISRRFGIMKMDLFTRIIDEIAPLRCSITLDVQGEPTLHPQFVDMVAYARSKEVYTSIITNATKLTAELAQSLIDLKLDRVVFSFDGIDKDIYESVRIRSKFEPTFKNVLNFIKLNHENGHPTHICMSMVYQDRTREHAQAYREFFERLPVDKVFLNPLLNLAGASGAQDEIDLSAIESQEPRENWPICRIPWEDLTVNWDGEVCSCPVDVNVRYSIGNVEQSSLQSMWNNQRMRQFRRAHLTKNYGLVEENGPLCGHCNCLWNPEYDLRNYTEYAVEAIYRNAAHFAHQLGEPCDDQTTEEKYQNLIKVIAQQKGNA